MRIHTHTLTESDFWDAMRYASRRTGGTGDSISAIRFAVYGSRTHTRSVDVVLTGTARHRSQADRSQYAATWREWGFFLGYLYTIDPDAKAGPYADESEFDRMTDGEFRVSNVLACCVSAIGPACEHMKGSR